jgi:endonuclease YncB( thermonuclease family)
MGYLLLILFLIFTVPASARPADPLPQLPTALKQQGKAGTVERVVDGDTLVLAPSGREIRLVGIQAPNYPWAGLALRYGRSPTKPGRP